MPLSCVTVCRDISSSEPYNWPKISPIVRLLAIQLCEKFEESGTFESRDMGLCDPQKCPFPVLLFAGISRVRNLTIGPKFHRLSVSWPYSCVKSLKKVGHSSLFVCMGTGFWYTGQCLQNHIIHNNIHLSQCWQARPGLLFSPLIPLLLITPIYY